MIVHTESPTPSYRFLFHFEYQNETHTSIKYWCLNVAFSPASIRDHVFDPDPEP